MQNRNAAVFAAAACFPVRFHAARSNASHPSNPSLPTPIADQPNYAEALILARALRSSNRACFLRRMTWKRSKSVRAFRLWACSRFLAQLLSFHLASI